MVMQSQPIDMAPVVSGEEWGPCLLFAPVWTPPETRQPCGASEPCRWQIGGWDGEAWHDDDHLVIDPCYWCPLPPAP